MCKKSGAGNTELSNNKKDGGAMYDNQFTPRAQSALRLAQEASICCWDCCGRRRAPPADAWWNRM